MLGGLLAVILGLGFIGIAHAAPGDLCFETGDGSMCDFTTAPLEAMIEPYNAIFGEPLFLTIVWGIILAVLWIRTQSTMLVGIVGILVSSSIAALYEPARQIGLILVAVAVGITLYQLIRHRLQEQTA